MKALVTLCVSGDDSMMFQMDGVCVAGLQSASCGIPWLPIATRGSPEEEVNDLKRGLEGRTDPKADFDGFWPEKWEKSEIILHDGELEIDALVTGALRSDYQRTRLDRMCSSLGIRSFSPLWHHGPHEHIRRFPSQGFEVRLSSISADGLGVQSEFFEARIIARYQDRYSYLTSLIYRDATTGQQSVLRRSFLRNFKSEATNKQADG